MSADDGRRDFDFLLGDWRIENWKLVNPLDEADDTSVTFPATAGNRMLLGGLGNVDDYRAPDMPGRVGFVGMALRLFDPETRTWRVWWASTATPGMLDTPVAGRFDGDHATLQSREVLGGREAVVRYEWWRHDAARAEWQQSFSFDGGDTWRMNWRMQWFRAGTGALGDD